MSLATITFNKDYPFELLPRAKERFEHWFVEKYGDDQFNKMEDIFRLAIENQVKSDYCENLLRSLQWDFFRAHEIHIEVLMQNSFRGASWRATIKAKGPRFPNIKMKIRSILGSSPEAYVVYSSKAGMRWDEARHWALRQAAEYLERMLADGLMKT